MNTVDEVPDSNWFTNRLGTRAVTVDELLKGPDTGNGPAPGTWTVIAAKNDGITPASPCGIPRGRCGSSSSTPPAIAPCRPGLKSWSRSCSGRSATTCRRSTWPPSRPDQLAIDDAARITPPSGKRRRFKQSDVYTLLRKAHRDADGSYRVIASKALEGKPVGGFRFYGTRSDDPNDIVAHEHRRELRAYGTFAAWVNHVDSKSINTLDTVITVDGRSVVRHNLLDFGSTVGSAGVYPREAFEGWEYLVEGGKTLKGIPTFGFYIKNWRTVPLYRARSVGSFPIDHSTWDPEVWKARYANSAFRSARLDDKFWAARRLQGFTDEMLKAVTRVGRFEDPTSEAALAKFLIDRRDGILRRYLPAVNPVLNVQLGADGKLTFRNAAVEAAVASEPAEYVVQWLRFDNLTGATTPIGSTKAPGPSVPAPKDLPSEAGSYLRAEISATGGPESWARPAHAYFVREATGWKLVGFERLPGGNPPNSARRTN